MSMLDGVPMDDVMISLTKYLAVSHRVYNGKRSCTRMCNGVRIHIFIPQPRTMRIMANVACNMRGVRSPDVGSGNFVSCLDK